MDDVIFEGIPRKKSFKRIGSRIAKSQKENIDKDLVMDVFNSILSRLSEGEFLDVDSNKNDWLDNDFGFGIVEPKINIGTRDYWEEKTEKELLDLKDRVSKIESELTPLTSFDDIDIDKARVEIIDHINEKIDLGAENIEDVEISFDLNIPIEIVESILKDLEEGGYVKQRN